MRPHTLNTSNVWACHCLLHVIRQISVKQVLWNWYLFIYCVLSFLRPWLGCDGNLCQKIECTSENDTVIIVLPSYRCNKTMSECGKYQSISVCSPHIHTVLRRGLITLNNWNHIVMLDHAYVGDLFVFIESPLCSIYDTWQQRKYSKHLMSAASIKHRHKQTYKIIAGNK